MTAPPDQSERFEPTEDMLLAAGNGDGTGARLARLLARTLWWIDGDYALSERSGRNSGCGKSWRPIWRGGWRRSGGM